jgi:lipopolysaccharide cholinephosphotransferase
LLSKHTLNKLDKIGDIFNFLKLQFPVMNVPPAIGNMRILQDAETKLMALVDVIFRKNNIPYFMNYGNLIGIVRHNSLFVPWDDDIDICLMYDDCLKAIKLFQSISEKDSDFKILIYDNNNPGGLSKIIYKDLLFIDIFPLFYYNNNDHDELRQKLNEARKLMKWPNAHTDISLQNEVVIDNSKSKSGNLIFEGIYFPHNPMCVMEHNEVFPLRDVNVDGYNFLIPNNTESILRKKYGDIYVYPNDMFTHVHLRIDSPERLKICKEFLSKPNNEYLKELNI